MLNIYTAILLISFFIFNPISQASERAEWEAVVNKTQSRNPNSVLQLLKDRYISLPPSSEKLYIASRIHEYMTKLGQQYFASDNSTLLSYSKEEKQFIEALNAEKNKQFIKASDLYQDLYSQVKQRQDSDGIILFEYHLCRLFNLSKDSLQSHNYCDQLNNSLKESLDPVVPRYRALTVIAKHHEQTGDYKGALDSYKRLLDELPEGTNTTAIFGDIGLLLCHLGQYQQALEYLYRALTLHIENGNNEGIAQIEHSLGEVYHHKGDLHQSINHFNKARLIHIKQNDIRGLAYVHLGLGKSHTELGAFHEGINHLLKGLDYAIQHKDISLKSELVLALSNSYVQKKYYRQAEYYGLKAKVLAEESQNIRTLTQALRQLAKIADKSGKYELALSYYREYVEHEMTIRNHEHFKALEALDQSTSSFEQKKIMSELLAQTEQLNNHVESMKQERRYLLLLIVLLLLAMAYLVHKSGRSTHEKSMDCLTDALHRTVFINQLKTVTAPSTIETRNVVILFDIDNLKLINDNYGYEVGNRALRTISNMVKQCLKTDDFWGRLGGDEFITVLNNVDQYEVQQRVESLHKALTSRPYWYHTNEIGKRKPLYLSTSFAFIATTGQISDFNQLYSVLDQALYKTKQKGQNCIFDACSDSIDCSFAVKTQ
ncbi:GGDEF domain-containing protein [Vibrio sp. Y2-5]|uniref:GGDEF domain-containing protein n=1 Tax=Vibrio sp. Y2-5 TaxID=2743977 RepID=UPI00166084CC|nr:diguanylate cyclase [Vibrio sp. Y2-5]MBD0786609.1 GGDEF domain-containing protein [Vibrio sp. Y2-5]